MNAANAPRKLPAWLWIAGGSLTALLFSLLVRDRAPEDSPRREPAARIDPRQIADAIYLRFIQDESTRTPEEKVARATDGVARSRGLDAAETRAALERFATQVEADSRRNDYDATLAAMIHGRFAAPTVSTSAPVDPLAIPLREIHGFIAAKDWGRAERALGDVRRRHDPARDPEGYARVQGAAFGLRYAQDRFDDAFKLAREVLAIRERVLPPDSPGLANALHNVGASLARQQRDEEAAPLLARAMGIYERAYGRDDVEVADTASELAAALVESEKFAEAEAVARRAISIFERAGENYALRLALALDRLGYTFLAAKRNADAEPLLRRAVQIYDRRPDARAKDHSDAVHRLGLSIARQDRRREALPYLKRSAEIGAKWFRDDDPLFAVLFHNLAVWADGAGDDPLTVEGYERALQILAKNQRRTKQEPAQMYRTRELYAAYLKRAGLSQPEIDRKLSEAVAR
ncbi:MAG: tetratricopeptide repeat protein [Chthoniobacteraceae bacterium]